MSSTDRQNRLLLAEDWKKIYQSFKYADFKSYDFDNLRRTMIEYLRTNYPEDFNDYIESSEYLALIDMIAFLGQNISFRVDLNARENFLELAERRESILRLARLLSYNPTRNRSASGLLKFSSVSTTENVRDSNGNSLSGRTIVWNDNVNSDWFEQFIKIINAALPSQNSFGRPVKLDNINGIPTEQYRLNTSQTGVPVYTFTKSVNNQSLDFEVVSTSFENGSIIEEPPLPGSQLGFLYRDNGQGAGSNSTGFFLHFSQGSLQRGDFAIDLPVPNQKVDIDTANINQTDIWLYRLNSNNNEDELWSKVDSVEGNNIVYNNLTKKIKNVYSVLTKTDDRVSLIFSDGVFGELPKGLFRVYYRTSINRDYTILPANITNVSIRIPYISNTGRSETLTVNLELKTPIDNASSSETNESIKNNAPSTYYTQNRLITGEDYNIGPLGISQDIVKVKAVNRTSSGISRYYDLLDPTGKYSTTNIFGTDGIIYKETIENKFNFNFLTKTDIESLIENEITKVLEDKNLRSFYLSNFLRQNYTELNLKWNQITADTNRSTGFINDENGIKYQAGSFTEGSLRYLESGAMVKFTPPVGSYFLPNGKLTTNPNQLGAKEYIWSRVITVSDSISVVNSSLGAIVFNDIIPNNSVLTEIQPKFVRDLSSDVKAEMIDEIFAYKIFGLRYDLIDRSWKIINQDNLDILSNFSTGLSGDRSNQQLDASWLLLFETDGETYQVTYRTLRYIFESDKEVRFYFDSANKIYDSKTGKIIKDTISILNINENLNSEIFRPYTYNFDWEISKEYIDIAGYVDSKKVEITFYDSDNDGVIDDPDMFTNITKENEYIFTKTVVINNGEFNVYVNAEEENIIVTDNINVLVENDPIFYTPSTNAFFKLNSESRILTQIFNYHAYIGRSNLKFQYVHASDENSRIDPSSSNIIDIYLLTKQYDNNFRLFLSNVINEKPLPQSNDQLFRSYGQEINKIKSISDEVIYHPVKYKILFGNKSERNMQAKFKVIKNSERVVNDNTLKSQVISAINNFFSLDNWDFGETFYWSELSAYIMKELSPNISSIIIVPNSPESAFGSLFEIKSDSDEIFINSATVDDVEIISAITADRLKSNGQIITSSTTPNTGVQSATGFNSNTTGGFIY